MSPAFRLDARLEADTIPIGELPLCAALLLDDARFPWVVLVPRRPGLTELVDLSDEDAQALIGEGRLAPAVLPGVASPARATPGALGTLVRRLHFPVVGGFGSDPAWPNPVWGF